MELNKERRQELREALISAFPNKNALKIMLLDQLDERLDNIVGGDNLTDIVNNLIVDWAEPQGRLEELIRGARQANPGNAKLREVAENLGFIERDNIPRSPLSRESRDMEQRDVEELVKILADRVFLSNLSSQVYLGNIARASNLPNNIAMNLAAALTGNPEFDARTFIQRSINQGVNPQDPKFTTLGSILNYLLPQLGLDDAKFIVALIVSYSLYQEEGLLEKLKVRYQVPLPFTQIKEIISNTGPDFVYKGPTDERELQGLWKPKPTLLDVTFLRRGIEQAASVCRIENSTGSVGTGFLLTENLLLTNYHVIAPDDKVDIDANIQDIKLRFGSYTSDFGNETEGQTFQLASDRPILKFSHTNQLDYILLQVEDRILQAQEIKPADWKDVRLPMKNTGINILQHPGGLTMKIALSSNGITGVYEQDGRIQYVSQTSGGSSGSPCFNDNWQVVALHHSTVAKPFGVVGEGILLSAIYQEISQYLSASPRD